MNTSDTVALICAHQDQVVRVMAWAAGIMPVASIGAWLTARYRILPPWAQRLLQVAAGNLLHAAAGEPAAK